MSGVSFAVGQRLTAAALQDAFDFITPQTYVKPAVESRQSTTTYAIDGDLKLIPLEVGQYEIELVGFFTETSGGTPTQKIKTQWRFTGTWNTPIRACIGPATDNTDAPNSVSDSTISGFVADSQDAVYHTSNSGSYSVFREVVRNCTVTAAGNLALYWAPAANVAANTNLQAGTSFTVRRIS